MKETIDQFFERCKKLFRELDKKDLGDILKYNHPV